MVSLRREPWYRIGSFSLVVHPPATGLGSDDGQAVDGAAPTQTPYGAVFFPGPGPHVRRRAERRSTPRLSWSGRAPWRTVAGPPRVEGMIEPEQGIDEEISQVLSHGRLCRAHHRPPGVFGYKYASLQPP